MKQLSGLDALFLYSESSRTPMEVSSLQIYDPSTAPGGRVRFKDILTKFGARLDRSRVFRRKLRDVPLGLDHPYWSDDPDFDLEYHVRHIALPAPGDWRQLMILIARLQGRQLDHARPLWEAYVIEGLDNVEGFPPGCFGLYMKMHHSTIDGATGQDIMAAIHDFEAAPSEMPPPIQPSPLRAPGNVRMLLRSAGNNLRQSARLLRVVTGAIPGAVEVLRSAGARSKVPQTRFNRGRVGPHRVIDGRLFDLAEMKAIRSAVPGSTLNDVVFAVVGGALRRYLEATGDLPEESLICGFPVDVRTEADTDVDNMVGTMLAPLCTDIADPLARLAAIHQHTTRAKAVHQSLGARLAPELTMNVPAPLGRLTYRAMMELGSRSGMVPLNTLITNVPGIQQPLFMSGARMLCMLGMGPVTDQAALFHGVFSYYGGISIAFTACRDALPDPDFYAECIQDAYEELRAAALAGGRSRTARVRGKARARPRKTAQPAARRAGAGSGRTRRRRA